jgi:hypothetical protein
VVIRFRACRSGVAPVEVLRRFKWIGRGFQEEAIRHVILAEAVAASPSARTRWRPSFLRRPFPPKAATVLAPVKDASRSWKPSMQASISRSISAAERSWKGSISPSSVSASAKNRRASRIACFSMWVLSIMPLFLPASAEPPSRQRIEQKR